MVPPKVYAVRHECNVRVAFALPGRAWLRSDGTPRCSERWNWAKRRLRKAATPKRRRWRACYQPWPSAENAGRRMQDGECRTENAGRRMQEGECRTEVVWALTSGITEWRICVQPLRRLRVSVVGENYGWELWVRVIDEGYDWRLWLMDLHRRYLEIYRIPYHTICVGYRV